MNDIAKETAWRRALKDSESFRHSGMFFWGFEVLGAAAFAAIVTYFFLPDDPSRFESAVYPLSGVVTGFVVAYALIYLWNIFRAPYRQRDQARGRLYVAEGGDRVSDAIRELRHYPVKNEVADDYADLLVLEFANDLAAGGITPDHWEDRTYKGLSHSRLQRFLGVLRLNGIVDVQRRTVERDKGYPYTVEDFFLSDFGARVVAQLQRELRVQYAEDNSVNA